MTTFSRLGALVVAVLCVSGCTCERRRGDAQQPVVKLGPVKSFIDRKKGLTGFKTKDGTVVVEPVYSATHAFSEGLAAVEKPGLGWGFVSTEGVEVIPPQFEAIIQFSEGRAAVKREGKWGYVDREGKVVLPFRFSQASSFSEGLAGVKPEGETLVGVIDMTGKMVIPPRFLYVGGFRNGYVDAKDPETKLCGFIDLRGEWVLAPEYDQCDNSTHTRGELTGHTRALWGFVGRDGSWRIPPIYADAWGFSEGVARASLRGGGGWVYLDGEGGILAGPYPEMEDFLDGEGEFHCGEGSGWGAMDARGRILRPCDPDAGRSSHGDRLAQKARENWARHLGKHRKLENVWLGPGHEPRRDDLWVAEADVDGLSIRQFRQGVAGFLRIDDPGCPPPWGILRANGSVVAEPRYSFVGEPSEGLIPVCVPVEGATKPWYCDQCHCPVPLNHCGYVDLDGKVRIPLDHLVDFNNRANHHVFIGGFHHGLAALQDGKKILTGFIDRTGKWVIAPQFHRVGPFAANGLAPASLPSTSFSFTPPER